MGTDATDPPRRGARYVDSILPGGQREKGSLPTTALQVRPLTADSWLSIFKPESVKQAQREKEEEEREAAKVSLGAAVLLFDRYTKIVRRPRL